MPCDLVSKKNQYMKQVFFTETIKRCLTLTKEIETINDKLFTNTNKNFSLYLKELSSICTINNSIIQSINTVQQEIFEGKINNHRQYIESDLVMIDVILNIYIQFGKENEISYSSNFEKLKTDFLNQIKFLKKSIELFPEDMATNVKRKPRVISTITLDYYQLIYLALSHSIIKIQGMLFTQNILELAKNKTVS